MKVKEIMVKDVKSLGGQEFVNEAMDLIFKSQISGLPVIDKENNLLGMFTEKDVLKSMLPSYLNQVGGFVYADNPNNIKKKFSSLSKLKVMDVMTKDVQTIKDNASLSEAARVMLVKDVRRIPVLDKDEKVVGIIARCDTLKAFRKMGLTK